jgi:hypothetical protein
VNFLRCSRIDSQETIQKGLGGFLNINRVSTWVWGRVSLLFVGQKAAQNWNKHEGNNVLGAKHMYGKG